MYRWASQDAFKQQLCFCWVMDCFAKRLPPTQFDLTKVVLRMAFVSGRSTCPMSNVQCQNCAAKPSLASSWNPLSACWPCSAARTQVHSVSPKPAYGVWSLWPADPTGVTASKSSHDHGLRRPAQHAALQAFASTFPAGRIPPGPSNRADHWMGRASHPPSGPSPWLRTAPLLVPSALPTPPCTRAGQRLWRSPLSCPAIWRPWRPLGSPAPQRATCERLDLPLSGHTCNWSCRCPWSETCPRSATSDRAASVATLHSRTEGYCNWSPPGKSWCASARSPFPSGHRSTRLDSRLAPPPSRCTRQQVSTGFNGFGLGTSALASTQSRDKFLCDWTLRLTMIQGLIVWNGDIVIMCQWQMQTATCCQLLTSTAVLRDL